MQLARKLEHFSVRVVHWTLDIPVTAVQIDIKTAYRRMAKKYHPDVCGNSGEKFREINEAYSVLIDIEKRRKYDEKFLIDGFARRAVKAYRNAANFVPGGNLYRASREC